MAGVAPSRMATQLARPTKAAVWSKRARSMATPPQPFEHRVMRQRTDPVAASKASRPGDSMDARRRRRSAGRINTIALPSGRPRASTGTNASPSEDNPTATAGSGIGGRDLADDGSRGAPDDLRNSELHPPLIRREQWIVALSPADDAAFLIDGECLDGRGPDIEADNDQLTSPAATSHRTTIVCRTANR